MFYSILIAVLTAYFLGNLNGAVCISAIISDDDVRKHGSGNAGLTNFIRNYGVHYAMLVILVDAGKAVLSCLLGSLLLQPYGMQDQGAALCGAAVMLGHACPALLGFRGGKAVLSGLFVAITLDWKIALLILGVFALVYFTTHYVSLASVLGAAAFSLGFVLWHRDQLQVMICGVFMGLLVILMHRGNILRLCKGQERKTNLFAKGKQE